MSSFTNMKCFVIVTLFAVAGSSIVPVKLPHYIKPCKAEDSNCLKNLFEGLAPHFIQGILEFDLPSIDPLNVPNYNQSDPQSPHFSYTATFTDMKYEGLGDFNVLKFNIDLDHYRLDLKLVFPHVVVTAYEVVSADGFGINLNGSGLTKGTFSNLTITFSLDAEEFLVKEKVHLKWKEDAITVSFDRAVYDPEASFTERKNYMKILDVGSDEYPQILNSQVQKLIKNTLGEFVLRRINFVHETFPVDVLYFAP